MKKIVSVLLCMALCLSLCPAVFAAETSGSCGDAVSWNFDASSGTLTLEGTGAMKDYEDLISIPWKTHCKNIKNIVISEGITSIGDYSLSWCEQVESVTVPSTVTRIGIDAFGWCSSLKNVSLPTGLKKLDREAFALCTALETIEIPQGVNEIGSMPFLSCYALKDINVSAENQKYKSFDGVLYDMQSSSLICYPLGKTATEFTVPSNITSIGASAFSGNKVLKSVDLSTVKEIGNKAFFTCSALYDVKMSSVENIYELAFYRCDNIVSITVPNTAISLGNEVFRNCTNLQLVMFENDAVSLGSNIFSGDPYVSIVGNEGSTCHYYAYGNSVPFNIFVDIYNNGSIVNFDPTAFIINDSYTLVPMRQVFDMLGAEVSWDSATNTASAVRGGITVSVSIGSNVMYRNGEAVALPVIGQLIADKTYIPLRAVSEAFGSVVNWDGANNAVYIAS